METKDQNRSPENASRRELLTAGPGARRCKPWSDGRAGLGRRFRS
jgi:hypothetical protein